MKSAVPAARLIDNPARILEAATDAFAASGFHGTPMREIARRAGVSQALLHHHYGTKEALWHAVGERVSAEFLAYVADVLASPPAASDTVPTAIRTYMRYWKEHPSAFRLNLWRLLEGPTAERSARSLALNKRAVPMIRNAQAAGLVRDDMPAGLALIIAGSLVQFWLHSQIEIRDALAVTGDPVPDDEAFADIVHRLIRTSNEPAKKKRRAARDAAR
ncbi:MAG TPA: TetR/AcrR family transcriptional regulator [Burkholderiaceae bacterium]|nr:TetR/AcrR family transcriptional regulator [Burkholderiaceae bacterium]